MANSKISPALLHEIIESTLKASEAIGNRPLRSLEEFTAEVEARIALEERAAKWKAEVIATKHLAI